MTVFSPAVGGTESFSSIMSHLSGLALAVLRGLFICALVGLELSFSGALATPDTTIVSTPGRLKNTKACCFCGKVAVRHNIAG